jgi:hypothetical protein
MLERLEVVVLEWVTVAVLESNDGANARRGASPAALRFLRSYKSEQETNECEKRMNEQETERRPRI